MLPDIMNCSDIICLIFPTTILTEKYSTKPNSLLKESCLGTI